MGDAAKQEIERALQEGMDALADVLRAIDEETAKAKPSSLSWSVLECVEHLALTEERLQARLKEAKPAGESHEDRKREARFEELAMNRLRRIEAPELVIPTHRTPTLAQALEAFQAARNETLRWLNAFDGDLRSWLTIHPLIARPVNCFEMLLLIALHPKRHALQIAEIHAALTRPDGRLS